MSGSVRSYPRKPRTGHDTVLPKSVVNLHLEMLAASRARDVLSFLAVIVDFDLKAAGWAFVRPDQITQRLTPGPYKPQDSIDSIATENGHGNPDDNILGFPGLKYEGSSDSKGKNGRGGREDVIQQAIGPKKFS